MGGTSVPMLLCQIAATRPKSVGTEVPPTKPRAGTRTSSRAVHCAAPRPVLQCGRHPAGVPPPCSVP
ncbi:DUF6053 domain-containing protein [Lysobacter enzymogenes]|uniref:DUF6053 domain-containing protein n=1 Tax=Lysobacter enzymogenes TaxID=69 RepID=UPI003D18AB3E